MEEQNAREPFLHIPDHLEAVSHEVIGAAIAVHKALGPGFLESHYESALCVELGVRQIPFKRQHSLALRYLDQPIGDCRIDLLVADELIVELKAVETISDIHRAQLLAYLKASKLRLGLLLNFNELRLKDGLFRIIN